MPSRPRFRQTFECPSSHDSPSGVRTHADAPGRRLDGLRALRLAVETSPRPPGLILLAALPATLMPLDCACPQSRYPEVL